MGYMLGYIAHGIQVWHIYLHVVYSYGKCIYKCYILYNLYMDPMGRGLVQKLLPSLKLT